MVFSKAAAAAALVLLVAATATCGAAGQGCGGRKVTVQNLCGRDMQLGIEPLANSPLLFPASGYTLRHGTHAEFPVCAWTGRIKVKSVGGSVDGVAAAPVAEFHVGQDGGAWYQIPTAQGGSPVRVSVTPHGRPLKGHCPTAGCSTGGHCFEHSVPGGNCHGVDELKIIYYP